MFENLSTLQLHVGLAIVLFSLGLLGVLFKRSALVVLMCIELMLNGVNLLLVSFNELYPNVEGYSLSLFVILVAAAEAGVGLSLLASIYRSKSFSLVEEMKELKF